MLFALAPHVEFTKPLHDVEVLEKETAKFECEVSKENAKVFLKTCLLNDYMFSDIGLGFNRFQDFKRLIKNTFCYIKMVDKKICELMKLI